jgi:hypothetical protein
MTSAILCFALALPCRAQEDDGEAGDLIVESYPEDVLERLQQADQITEVALTDDSTFAESLNYFIAPSLLWPTGVTLRFAFRAGSLELREFVADACSEWTKHANLSFEFKDPATGEFYEWTPQDTTYRFHVRIGFDKPGYWSALGVDSVNSAKFGPGQTSLNLQGFDRIIPRGGRKTVMHECGHALGFQHEHFNPNGNCETQFRFDDDPGYIPTKRDGAYEYKFDAQGRWPGIYLYMSGYPNRWSRRQVDFNIRNRPQSNAYDDGSVEIASAQVDRNSIMIYELPWFLYVGGKNDPCFGQRLETLSAGDQNGARLLYPSSFDTATKSAEETAEALSFDFNELESHDFGSVDPSVAMFYEAVQTQTGVLLDMQYSE